MGPAYRTLPSSSGRGGAATADDKRRPKIPRLVGDQLPSPRLSQLEVLEARPPWLLPDEARPTYPIRPPPLLLPGALDTLPLLLLSDEDRPTYPTCPPPAEDHKRVSPKTDDAFDVRRPKSNDDSCCTGCAACAPSSCSLEPPNHRPNSEDSRRSSNTGGDVPAIVRWIEHP